MDDCEFFDASFQALTGNRPLGWQRRLFGEHFVRSDIPIALDIPTGLGKTSVIVIWLLALARQVRTGNVFLPRRLVYVVNRRTVVDQATDVAENLRERLRGAHHSEDDITKRLRDALCRLCIDPEDQASPLAISTLRGELADNREWQGDPARPAIIVGTVDMIGSRLLFSGYGVSRRMRPFHAGLLGHDVLLVHDEAHLTPAFGDLIRELVRRQNPRRTPAHEVDRIIRPLQLLELSATRTGSERGFSLKVDDDENDEEAQAEVDRRLTASKTLHFENSYEEHSMALAAMTQCAVAYAGTRKRMVVYVRSPKDAKEIAHRLADKIGADRVAVLTGTIRGYERDLLTEKEPDRVPEELKKFNHIFRGLRSNINRAPAENSEYLIATSAGEVGVDLDADNMVCDLVTLDSMIQRLGRVNRLGRGAAMVHIFELPRKRHDQELGDADERLIATKDALQSLPPRDGGYDASPKALRSLAARVDAFAKVPRTVPLTDILLDGWSLTRIDDLPGRPPVERWLHGITSDPPSVYVAWRQEVDNIVNADDPSLAMKTLLDRHSILARERVRGDRNSVIEELKKIASRSKDRKVILLSARGTADAEPLGDLLAKEHEDRLNEATIVLPTDVGGLDRQGMLDGTQTEPVRDVADVDSDPAGRGPARLRILLTWHAENNEWSARALGARETGQLEAVAEAVQFRAAIEGVRRSKRLADFREKGRIILARDDDGTETRALLLLARRGSIEAAEESQESAGTPVDLAKHNDEVKEEAENIVRRLGLEPIGQAVVLAAERHDLGKARPAWQKAIGHPPPRSKRGNGGLDWRPWAKSGRRGFDASACGEYRHEFGSLREAAADSAIRVHPERDLILHLIAAHHGWARPHFKPEQWDIADDVSEEENAVVAADALARFARLQRRFGHWGLAWLEALMRAADYTASKRLPDDH